ncbi:MAG: ECF-type sigma factor, partial [Vicinamibacterales bacterium]
RDAAEALYAVTYQQLRRLARARLRSVERHVLLDTGALVHESFVRFAAAGQLRIADRTHFMRWASRAMRSIIVDLARRRLAERRGGAAEHVPLDADVSDGAGGRSGAEEILAVHEALERLAEADPRATHVVEMRYFSGMTEPEIADALSVTERTVRRDWQRARLLLRAALA